MQVRPAQVVLKLMPSMSDFAFLVPTVLLFGRMDGMKSMLSDCDTGWHIRTGEWILSHHQIPTRDFFSFTKAGQPWFAWEWLSDVVFAWLNSHGGLATVVLASILTLAATFTILFRLARRKANPMVAFLVTVAAAILSSVHWLARPHLFTLVFLVVFYGVLESIREGKRSFRALAVLPAATILWTNLHGGFFLGIVLIGAYAVGEMLKAILTEETQEARLARRVLTPGVRAYAVTALACLAASLLNPYTYHLHQHLVEYLRDPFASRYIAEFLSISFHHPVAPFFEFLLAAGVAAALWNISKGSYTEAMLLVVFGHAALLASRNLALYGIIATPIVAAAIEAWLRSLPQAKVAGWVRRAAAKLVAAGTDMAETEAVGRWHLTSAAALAVIAALLYAPAPPPSFRPEYDPASYPAAAIALLKQNPSARIFTDDEWGDYLIYRLYPATRVFVDGRSDFYGDTFEQKYQDVMHVKYDWENTLSRYGIDTILLRASAELAGALKESSRWNLVYDDGVALVFRASQGKPGNSVSTTLPGGGTRGDHEVTKTEARDPAVPLLKTTT
jgi:hypothetical protein